MTWLWLQSDENYVNSKETHNDIVLCKIENHDVRLMTKVDWIWDKT